MKLNRAQTLAIARVLGNINPNYIQAAATKLPHEMTLDEYRSVFAADALRMTEFDSRLGSNLRPISTEQFLYRSYLDNLNKAMEENLEIPLSILRERSGLLDKHKLIRYLQSIGLDRRKLSQMNDQEIDDFLPVVRKRTNHRLIRP